MSVWCFNGWAQPADGLQALAADSRSIDYAAHATPEALWRALPSEAPDMLIGWSLGGQLAVRAVLEAGIRPRALVLIGTPWRFVSGPDWPHGMGRSTYELFVQNYTTQPERTARRFAHLVAQGDARAAEILQEQSAHLAEMADHARWLPWLRALDAWSPPARPDLPPTLLVQGANDGIVPPAQAAQWREALPQAEVMQWEGCGHAPHLHNPARLRAAVEHWRKSCHLRTESAAGSPSPLEGEGGSEAEG